MGYTHRLHARAQQNGLLAGREQHTLEMTSPVQDDSVCILDILASFLYNRRKWGCVVQL